MISNKIGYLFKRALLPAAIVASSFPVQTYAADDVGSQASSMLEEVVVTARKREESLMETPVSITAFSADMLTDMNITSADQIAEQTPGLVFDSTSNISGSANSSSIFIRGIGQRDYTLAVEPGVGIYVDDVYLAHSIGNVIDVVDVERIEVLRGPQGTLFGRNTIGGAVRVVTKKPTEEYEGLVEFTAGRYNRRDIKGQINIPLNDQLYMRLSGLTQENDGFVDRPFLSGKSGDKDSTSLIGQLRWVPDDEFTADLLITYSQDRSNGAPMLLLSAETGQGNPATFANQVAPALNPTINNFLFGPQFIGWDGDECPCTDWSDSNIEQDLDTWSTALTLDWQLNENLSLKSITAYRNLESNFGRDADHVPEVQNIDLFFYTEYEQWSQEFQLSGTSFDGGVDWIAGLYYYYEEGQSDDFIQFVTLDLLSGGEFETEDYAVFGQATWHITDKLDLTLGVRYTDEEKTSIIDGIEHQVVTAFLGGAAFKVPNSASFQVVPPGTYVDGVTETEPYINLSYNWSDGLMTYASYSEGFKGGGTQVRNGPIGFLPVFGPEFAEVIEVGAKWSLLEGRMNVSMAAFRTDYKDMQITAVVNPPGFAPTSVVTNAGDAEIDGFELEIIAMPIPELRINAGISLLDGEYTKLLNAPGITLNSDLPNAPEVQWNLSIAYDIDTAKGIFTPRVDYSYSDEQFNDATNSESIKRDQVNMLNLSLGYESEDGQWSGALFVKNTLDEQVILAGFDGGFYADGAVSRPREWGIRIRRDF